jgi:hypothetical protein
MGWRAGLREPLVHFLILGAALFAVFQIRAAGPAGPSQDIVVTASRVDALSANFKKTWMRPPTVQELRGLVDDYIADEVYYREAIAMGIDRDDAVIRRRLRQKMEFMSDSVVDVADPTDAQLQDFLRRHPAKFAKPARLSFEQVFVSAERRGSAARTDAARILASLTAGRGPADPHELGDPTLLPSRLEVASVQEIASTFGTAFAAQIDESPVGQWSGPLRSGYGLHLVRVDGRELGSLPTLAEIRPIVLREWQAAQSLRAKDAFLTRLLAKYRVRIEGPAGLLLQSPARAEGTTR